MASRANKRRKTLEERVDEDVDSQVESQVSSDVSDGGCDSDYEPEPEQTKPSSGKKRPLKENRAPTSAKKVDHEKVVNTLRRQLAKQISDKMIYKKSLKGGSGRTDGIIPNVTMDDVEGILGPTLLGKASNGRKQLVVKTSESDLVSVFGTSFNKSLRYGASLCLKDDALKITYDKENLVLKVTGTYIMVK